MRAWGLVAALLVPSSGCGDAAGDPPDGSAADTATDAVGRAIEVAPAAPPEWPCPDGWSEQSSAGATWCAPSVATSDGCGPHEAHFVGEPGCRPIGAACPAGKWPEGLPADRRVLFVDAEASLDGDGTKEAPYGTIGQAMSRANVSTIVALATGTYETAVKLRAGVTLWGACPGETVIAAPDRDMSAGTVTVEGDGAEIRNLRISGERPGVWVDSTSVRLDGVLVSEAWYVGIASSAGGRVEGERVVVRGTRRRDDGRFGYGITVLESGAVELSEVVLEGNHGHGVGMGHAGTTVTLTDAVVRDTQPHAGGRFGSGLSVNEGAALTIRRALVEGNRECGISVHGSETTLQMRDVLVRDTRPREVDGEIGCGLEVRDGGADAERVAFVSNHYYGVAVHASGTRLSLSDAVIAATRATESVDNGLGLVVDAGPQVELARVTLSNNRGWGILARGEDTEVALEDVTVRDTHSTDPDGEAGRGIEANAGASVEGSRVSIRGNRDGGLVAFDRGTSFQVRDLLVTETAERACASDACAGAAAGVGVVVTLGAAVDLEEFAISRNALCGIQLLQGQLDLRRGLIADNPIGINIQTSDYDRTRLADEVVYRGDDQDNVQQQELPEPQSSQFGIR